MCSSGVDEEWFKEPIRYIPEDLPILLNIYHRPSE